jgi:hypothetical protein
MREYFNVAFLMSANVGGGFLQRFLDNMEPLMHFLVAFGQIAVAVVTVIYVWNKIKNQRDNRKKRDEK